MGLRERWSGEEGIKRRQGSEGGGVAEKIVEHIEGAGGLVGGGGGERAGGGRGGGEGGGGGGGGGVRDGGTVGLTHSMRLG